MRFEGYKTIAPFYELLRNFFFPDIKRFQREFHKLKPHLIHRIAIVGGGAGDILNPVMNKFPEATIYFIEPSSAMMERARKRFGTSRRIFFIEDRPENAVIEDMDLVILPFVVDVIEEEEQETFARTVNEILKNKGFILFADFHPSEAVWVKIKLFLLYMIFWPLRGKMQSGLPDYDLFFKNANAHLVAEKRSKSGFIVNRLYQAHKWSLPISLFQLLNNFFAVAREKGIFVNNHGTLE